jgi:large subunit ribosomal protein L30
MASNLVITQHKSSAGANGPQRDTLRSLGLRGIGSSTERPDRPEVRGMLRVVAHLVKVEEGAGA